MDELERGAEGLMDPIYRHQGRTDLRCKRRTDTEVLYVIVPVQVHVAVRLVNCFGIFA